MDVFFPYSESQASVSVKHPRVLLSTYSPFTLCILINSSLVHRAMRSPSITYTLGMSQFAHFSMCVIPETTFCIVTLGCCLNIFTDCTDNTIVLLLMELFLLPYSWAAPLTKHPPPPPCFFLWIHPNNVSSCWNLEEVFCFQWSTQEVAVSFQGISFCPHARHMSLSSVYLGKL